MPRGMVVPGLVLGVLLVSFWASDRFGRSDSTTEDLQLLAEPEPQGRRERTWKLSPTLVSRIGAEQVLQATLSEIHGEHLFVLDWRDQAVKRFSLSGELTAVMRMARHEFSQEAFPSDFDVSPSGELYVAYRDLGAIGVFGRDGQLLRSLQLPKSPHRVAVLSDSEFVVMTGEPDPFLFHRFSAEGHLQSSFGTLVHGLQHPLPLDGWIASDRHLGIVFASFHSGLLARFDATRGEPVFLVEGMKPGPLPSVVTGSSGRQRVEPGSPFYSLAVSVDSDRIYVLSERHQRLGPRALDVFDLSNGRYLWSTRLQETLTHASVRGGLLFGGSTKNLGIWRLPRSSSPRPVAQKMLTARSVPDISTTTEAHGEDSFASVQTAPVP